MAFKSVTNSGVSNSDLKRGYTDTGAIPEEFDNVQTADADAAKEAKERATYGYMPEPVREGFMGDC